MGRERERGQREKREWGEGERQRGEREGGEGERREIDRDLIR